GSLENEAVCLQPLLQRWRVIDDVCIERRWHHRQRPLQQLHRRLLVTRDERAYLLRLTAVPAEHKSIRLRERRLRQPLLQRSQQATAIGAERLAIQAEIGDRPRSNPARASRHLP